MSTSGWEMISKLTISPTYKPPSGCRYIREHAAANSADGPVAHFTNAMVFAIRGDIETAMSAAFQLTKEQMGTIWSPAFWAFTISIFISGALVDLVGLRALHILSAVGYFLGIGLVLGVVKLGVGADAAHQVGQRLLEGYRAGGHDLEAVFGAQFGSIATSYVRGVRTKNWSNTQLYCEQLESGKRAIESREELSPIARAGETAAAEEALQIAEHAIVAIRSRENPVHEVRAGNVQPFLRDFRVFEVEQRVGLGVAVHERHALLLELLQVDVRTIQGFLIFRRLSSFRYFFAHAMHSP